MKKLFIFNAGHSFPDSLKTHGDFDSWIIRESQITEDQLIKVEVQHGQALPDFKDCAGVIITGSHEMVTDNLPWSLAIEAWLRDSVEHKIPVLGICYGHQLIAKALGGLVDYHPQGIEIGSVAVELKARAQEDAIFKSLPQHFPAHATHSQSVRSLPENAVHLASNDFEKNHAFRVGNCIWGVQFHPEFNTEVMKLYINKQIPAIQQSGQIAQALEKQVVETPAASQVLRNFVALTKQA